MPKYSKKEKAGYVTHAQKGKCEQQLARAMCTSSSPLTPATQSVSDVTAPPQETPGPLKNIFQAPRKPKQSLQFYRFVKAGSSLKILNMRFLLVLKSKSYNKKKRSKNMVWIYCI